MQKIMDDLLWFKRSKLIGCISSGCQQPKRDSNLKMALAQKYFKFIEVGVEVVAFTYQMDVVLLKRTLAV